MDDREITGKNLTSGRMANLELLRCIAMMMVVVLHFLGKGKLLPALDGQEMGAAGYTAWMLESFCIVAVNVYMFISGYFLGAASFRPSRLIRLYLQIWLYSVCFGLVGAFTGILTETAFDTHYLLTLVFPVSMNHYWFMTAYVFLYLLLPFVGGAVRRMGREQLRAAIGLLFLAFCLLKSVLPVRLETDNMGYDCLWYLCVFLAAAYMRRFGVAFLEKRGRGAAVYILCCLLIFAGTMGLRSIYLRTGSFGLLLKLFLEYNHVLPFLAAAGLFSAFLRLKVGGGFGRVVTRIAPHTLGVYLLHENIGFRYSWQGWFGAAGIASASGLLFGTAAAAAGVFVCGILVDMLRSALGKGLERLLCPLGFYRKLREKMGRADALFKDWGGGLS